MLVLLVGFFCRMCWEDYQFVYWNFPDAFAVWICPDVFAQLSCTFGFACPSARQYNNKHWHHLLFPLVVITAGDMSSLQSFGCFLGSFLLLNKHLVNIGERFARTCFFYLCWFQSPWGLASPTGCNDFALSFGCPVMNGCMFVACLVLLLCYAHYICRLGSGCKTSLSSLQCCCICRYWYFVKQVVQLMEYPFMYISCAQCALTMTTFKQV